MTEMYYKPVDLCRLMLKCPLARFMLADDGL